MLNFYIFFLQLLNLGLDLLESSIFFFEVVEVSHFLVERNIFMNFSFAWLKEEAWAHLVFHSGFLGHAPKCSDQFFGRSYVLNFLDNLSVLFIYFIHFVIRLAPWHYQHRWLFVYNIFTCLDVDILLTERSLCEIVASAHGRCHSPQDLGFALHVRMCYLAVVFSNSELLFVFLHGKLFIVRVVLSWEYLDSLWAYPAFIDLQIR